MWLLEQPLFTEILIPFLLVFVLVFAVLQKTKVLGDKKNQVDALVSLALALILIVTPIAREFITNITPWLAVGLVVILTFLVLYGFVGSDKKEGIVIEKWMKTTFAGLAGLFVLVLVLIYSGVWDKIFHGSLGTTSWLPNIIFLIVIIVAMVIALGGKKDD
ncbi:hypothetical protein H8D91_01205 [archaeon]|nr:hypothetical protein [archaeon]